MQPHIRFTALFWAIGHLIDEGQTESVETIQAKIEDGSLFLYLSDKYADTDLSLLSGVDRDALLSLFRSSANSVDARRKFGIERNGLLLLVAYAMEGIQQTVDSSHELDLY